MGVEVQKGDSRIVYTPNYYQKRLLSRGVDFTNKIALKFCELLPVGHRNAMETNSLLERMRISNIFKDVKKFDHNFLQLISEAAVICYELPVGSSTYGRFIIETKKDKEVALEYIVQYANNRGKVRDKNTGVIVESVYCTLRYKIIESLEVVDRPAVVMDVKKRFKIDSSDGSFKRRDKKKNGKKKTKEKKKVKKKNGEPDLVLLKDIVIPKGTVFTVASRETKRYGEGHYEATIGLSKNTSGSIHYSIDDDEEIMEEYFTTLK